MKPGASVSPAASTTVSPIAGPAPPTSTMRSPEMRTFVLRAGEPVPSRTAAWTMTVTGAAGDASRAAGAAEEAYSRAGAAGTRAATSSSPRRTRLWRFVDITRLLSEVSGAPAPPVRPGECVPPSWMRLFVGQRAHRSVDAPDHLTQRRRGGEPPGTPASRGVSRARLEDESGMLGWCDFECQDATPLRARIQIPRTGSLPGDALLTGLSAGKSLRRLTPAPRGHQLCLQGSGITC